MLLVHLDERLWELLLLPSVLFFSYWITILEKPLVSTPPRVCLVGAVQQPDSDSFSDLEQNIASGIGFASKSTLSISSFTEHLNSELYRFGCKALIIFGRYGGWLSPRAISSILSICLHSSIISVLRPLMSRCGAGLGIWSVSLFSSLFMDYSKDFCISSILMASESSTTYFTYYILTR